MFKFHLPKKKEIEPSVGTFELKSGGISFGFMPYIKEKGSIQMKFFESFPQMENFKSRKEAVDFAVSLMSPEMNNPNEVKSNQLH